VNRRLALAPSNVAALGDSGLPGNSARSPRAGSFPRGDIERLEGLISQGRCLGGERIPLPRPTCLRGERQGAGPFPDRARNPQVMRAGG